MFSSLSGFSDLSLLILRIAIGSVFIVHGPPKLKNPAGIAGSIGAPVWFGTLLGLGETVGGIGVLVGLLTSLSALVLAIVMLGALYFKIEKWHMPFTAMDKTGWELDLVLFASALVLLTMGPGAIALSAALGM